MRILVVDDEPALREMAGEILSSRGHDVILAKDGVEGLDLYLAMLGDSGIPWAIAIVGGAVLEHPLTRAALERGAHLRVGLEDQPDGPANAALVVGAIALCAEVGRSVASLAETEAILGLPG